MTAIKKRVAITLPSICLSSSTHKPYSNCQLTVDCCNPCNSEIFGSPTISQLLLMRMHL
nr:MAG TPA: hypothetical protein [Caudoviricetes sp.]